MPRPMLIIINPWLQYFICNCLLDGCKNYYTWTNINIGFVLDLIYIYMEDEDVFGIIKNNPPSHGICMIILFVLSDWTIPNILCNRTFIKCCISSKVVIFLIDLIPKWSNAFGNTCHLFEFNSCHTLYSMLTLFYLI